MSKYIDAEKLIHDLTERIFAYSEGYAKGDDYRKDAIETLLKDIKYQCSLQQEQKDIIILNKKDWEKQEQFRKDKKFGIPLQQEQFEQDFTEFEKAMHNFGEAYATLVDKDNNPNQGIRVNAYHKLVQESIGRILELAKEYTKQEQPEVDLEEEVKEWMKYGPHTCYPWCSVPDAIEITAHHFYELGKLCSK